MIPVLTRAQMRAFDRYAIEMFHVPGAVLMENAGRGAADVISALIEARHEGSGYEAVLAALLAELDETSGREIAAVALHANAA
jgi:NAD(P)H-hydrate epimerase